MPPALGRIRTLARRSPTFGLAELGSRGLARSQVSRLVAAGKLIRVARGIYALPDFRPGVHGDLAIVARRMPDVVFCLLTALRLHDLTTQAPHEIWIAIANKRHPPRIANPPLRVVRLSDAALKSGVERRVVDGVPIRVTTIARTVADCFKFRNRIGLDVALEALREAWGGGRKSRRITMDALWAAARSSRVSNVMRPYLESLA